MSKATTQLDETLEAWRNRPLDEFQYVFLDARYEKVRQNGQVRDAAILIAVGVGQNGNRQFLGILLSMIVHEATGGPSCKNLVTRGLGSVPLITSDNHVGLKAARIRIFSGVPWQRCQSHLRQNAGAHVPRKEMQREVAEDLRIIFNAPDRHMVKAYLAKTVQKYAQTVPTLANWLEKNVPEGLTVFSFPASKRRRLRTANGLERLSREIKRGTRVVSIFPNDAACL